MFGTAEHSQINRFLNDAFATRNPLVAVHRGTGLGSIAENTVPAITAALAQGADMVEIDIVESTDGEFFLFHDGYEPMHFGIEENLRTLSSEAIGALHYRWCSDDKPYPVTRLADVLTAHPDTLFNVDRSWDFWPTLLPYLDQFDHPGRLVLKSPARQDLLEQLAAHSVKYPFVPIVRSHAEVQQVLATPGLNVVGMELIAPSADHEFAQRGYAQWLHERGLLVLANALNLGNGVPLFAGWDDEVSVLTSPEAGWGRLIGLGADIIQTDWPGMLVPYRNRLAAGSLPAETRMSNSARG